MDLRALNLQRGENTHNTQYWNIQIQTYQNIYLYISNKGHIRWVTEAQLITPAASTIKDKVDVIFPVADKLKTKTRNTVRYQVSCLKACLWISAEPPQTAMGQFYIVAKPCNYITAWRKLRHNALSPSGWQCWRRSQKTLHKLIEHHNPREMTHSTMGIWSICFTSRIHIFIW